MKSLQQQSLIKRYSYVYFTQLD